MGVDRSGAVAAKAAAAAAAAPATATAAAAAATAAAVVSATAAVPAPLVRRRATQTIPPALRRAVLLRDQRRCQVPGCQNTSWLDLHHLEPRSEGGRHSLDNLACLCGAHHRAAHRGELLLDRGAGGALRVRHADGSAYGAAVNPLELEVRSKVLSALCHLGFREARVRAVLEQLLGEPAVDRNSFAGLLRAALALLCPSGGRR